MGAVEPAGESNGGLAACRHRFRHSPLDSLTFKSKSRTGLETRAISTGRPLTRCNALPNVDRTRELEIIPYLCLGHPRLHAEGLNDAAAPERAARRGPRAQRDPGFADSAPYEDLKVKKK